jgi:stress-induced morphogen
MLHLNYKPYGCNVCGKRFTNSSVLMAHRRVHTGEKPYKCEVCHKTFTQNGTLKRHKMVHTGEKPFACNLCDWRGTQLFLLMQHKRSHHFGEKPYSCTICHKTFSFSSSLQLHQRTHTGEKPYKCEYCSKSFTQNGSLNRHKLNNHNIMTKRQWQNRCFQEQVQVQPENLSSSVFHKIESHFPAGALPPISAPGRLPESAAGLMLKAAAPNLSPPAFADMSHLTRYMQAYQPHVTRPHPHDFSPTAASHLDWGMSKPGYTETEPISPESSVKHGGDSTPSRQSVQSPASIPETQAPPPPNSEESSSVRNKDHPMESPDYSKDMPMNYEHENQDYREPGGPTPMGVDYSDKKDHDRPSVMYLPHEYVNDMGPNSSRPGSNSDKFNSSQSAESGYLSPQTNTDTDDNSTVHESHTAVVRTVSSFPRITDPIKRLGHKSRSGSREKLTLDQTISRLSGRASVEDRSRFSMGQVTMEDQTISQVSGRSSVDSTSGSVTTPVPEAIPSAAMMSPTRVGSPKALNTFSVEELLNNLYTRGKVHYCEHCQVFFVDAAMYFIHRGTHDPHQPYKCSLCTYTARDRYDFSSHFLEHK